MRDDLVAIYHGRTHDDTLRLADRLRELGVESFVETTQSPLYGMRAGPAGRTLYVRGPATELVREAVHRFKVEEAGQVPRGERQREETGLELPVGEKPSEDSFAEGVGEMTEEMDAERPGPDTPELASVDDGLDEGQIKSMDVDRDYAQSPEFESEEVEDQPIDELDVARFTGEGPAETPEQERARRERIESGAKEGEEEDRTRGGGRRGRSRERG